MPVGYRQIGRDGLPTIPAQSGTKPDIGLVFHQEFTSNIPGQQKLIRKKPFNSKNHTFDNSATIPQANRAFDHSVEIDDRNPTFENYDDRNPT